MRLLSPFGPEALPIIKVLRTDSTSSGVRTIVFNSELRSSGIKLLNRYKSDYSYSFACLWTK